MGSYMKRRQQLLPILAGLAVAFIFGLSFLFSKESLAVMAPLELLAHRFSVATLFMLVLVVFGVVKVRMDRKLFWDLLPLVLFQPIGYFIGETAGVQLTSASESGLIISLTPIGVTLLGGIMLKEKANWKQWLFVLLSVTGVILIVLAGSGLTAGIHTLGIIALLGAVTAASVYNILARKSAARYSAVAITLVMMLSGAVFFNLAFWCSLTDKKLYFQAFTEPIALVGLGYLGILSSGVAFFLLNYMLARKPAAWAANFMNLTTIVSVAAGVLFRGEAFGPAHLVGGVLIFAGVWGTTTLPFAPPSPAASGGPQKIL